MNTKKIYIASSAEISKELGLIQSMIEKMNHKSVKYEFIRWENMPVEFGKERFQDTYNEIISNCDIIIFVFDKTIGLYSIEEFNIALEEFYRRGAPHIFLYVKELQEGESNDSSLNAFLLKISDTGQYYCTFQNYEELAYSIEFQLLQSCDKNEHIASDVDKLQLEATVIMSNSSIDTEERIKRVDKLFGDAEKNVAGMSIERDNYISILSRHVEFLFKQEQYYKTLNVCQRLLDVAYSFYGEIHFVVAMAYKYLGEAQYYIGDIQNAIQSLRKAEKLYHMLSGDYVYDIRDIYTHLGFSYKQYGDYENAFKYFQLLIELYNKVGTENLYLITIFRTLGEICRELAEYDKSLLYYHEALSFVEGTNENVAIKTSIFYDIAIVYYAQQNNSEALYYLGKAEELLKDFKVKGQSYAGISMSVGSYYATMGDYEKSIRLLNNALEIYEQQLGCEHPTTISIYNNLAVVYSKQGDYSKSMEYNLKATINRRKQRWDVYLSYSKDDNETAKIFEKVLDENGITYTSKYDVVIEEGINGKGISDGINNSEICIALVSKDYFKEELCTKEFQTAFESKGKDQFQIFIAKREGLPSYIEEGAYTFNIRDLSDVDSSSIKERITQVINGLIRKESITKEQRQFNLEAAKERREGPANYVPRKNDTDVFISYRRKDGRHHARIIELALKLSGYENIFFDFSSLKDGVFNTEIYDAIFSCKDFILVLTPLALKKCSEEGDWVAKEIRYAIKYNRKIIPVVIGDTFNGWPKDFPEDMNCVKDIHQHKLVDDEYFDDSISKLVSRLSATVNKTTTKGVDGPFYKIKANKKSRLFIDDEEVAILEPSKLTKLPLSKGHYFRKVQDCENENVEDETTISINDCDIVEKVMLP